MRNTSVDNLSLVLQALSLEILFKDYNNYDLMNELQTQNEKYLKTIIRNQEEILKLLKERSEQIGRQSNRKS